MIILFHLAVYLFIVRLCRSSSLFFPDYLSGLDLGASCERFTADQSLADTSLGSVDYDPPSGQHIFTARLFFPVALFFVMLFLSHFSFLFSFIICMLHLLTVSVRKKRAINFTSALVCD